MKLRETFLIPADRDRSWRLLQDTREVAGCLPGAQLVDVDGDTCTGRIKVKIGPIVMVYDGEVEFTGRDERNGRLTMRGRGRDRRGAGTVAAEVALAMEQTATAETTCTVDVDLDITGKPAQFGRAVIQDVSARLVQQFAGNLEALVDAPEGAPGERGPVPPAAEPFDVLGGSRLRSGIVAGGTVVAAALLLLAGWLRRGRGVRR